MICDILGQDTNYVPQIFLMPKNSDNYVSHKQNGFVARSLKNICAHGFGRLSRICH